MRTVETKAYHFAELSPEAQDKAIEALYDINVRFEWWESVYEDAESIGLKIEAFDIDRGNCLEGEFTQSALKVAQAIIADHGTSCETRKTAEKYLPNLEYPDDSILDAEAYDKALGEYENSCHEFEVDLEEDYLCILRKEYEYQASREAIVESIEANEYEFTENGKLV